VYEDAHASHYLYALLAQREMHESISHKTMPEVPDHIAFIDSKPYEAWYLVWVGSAPVGAVYLSKQREIGIAIFKEHRRRGYGVKAVVALMELHPGKFLANINPGNAGSQAMFRKLGFDMVQVTYGVEA
jgi:RimJ/RimL family protein N-acetyltransferase